MTTTQQVFYIIASIALGLMAIFLLIGTILLIFIQREMTRLSRHLGLVLDEAYGFLENGRSIGRYLRSNMAGKILRAIYHIINRD